MIWRGPNTVPGKRSPSADRPTMNAVPATEKVMAQVIAMPISPRSRRKNPTMPRSLSEVDELSTPKYATRAGLVPESPG